jgi:hypothetical protein
MKQFRVSDIKNLSNEKIEKALKAGTDPSVLVPGTDTLSRTPLMCCVDFNKGDGYGTTPICYVIRYNPGFLFYILKSSPSLVNSSCFNNTTPLDVAMGYDYNCVPILLDAGAKIRKAITVIIPDYVTVLVQKRNRLKRKIILFLALSKKTKAVHKDLLSTISKMVWELRDTEEKEEESPSKKEFVKK